MYINYMYIYILYSFIFVLVLDFNTLYFIIIYILYIQKVKSTDWDYFAAPEIPSSPTNCPPMIFGG